MSEEPGEVTELTAPTCYRHAGRETHIRCQRCNRPICPDCMNQASVGFQCPECVREGARTTRQPRTAYGGAHGGTPGRITMTLIAINVAVFVLVAASRATALSFLALIPVSRPVRQAGELVVARGVADGAYWQLLTSMFTHVQLWHIVFNMLALYVLGPQLEALLGRWRYLALYLLSGFCGSLAVYWLAPPLSVTVGASGALFGLMAALLIVAIKTRRDVQSLLVLVLINTVITVIGAGFISWQGHLGGFVGGLLLGAVLVYAPRRRRTAWQLAGVGLVATVVLIGVVLRTLALT